VGRGDDSYFQEVRSEISDFQEGNEMGSIKDIIDFHEGRRKTSYFQVVNKKVRLYESLKKS
jgi:hypothetical protein